ncbi:MAG TPA: hypothetical protein VHS74_01975, partial [Solirubrobacterales bacterium]|nr:hypothetical protein [Solirubrobacterales bacterium]
MEANLVGGEVAKDKREFPYANWGPWPAVFAVLIALCVGLFLSVPALIVGSQNGKIEALFPPSYSSGASFDSGNSSALAVDSKGHRLFADHEDEVRVFGALGQEIPSQRIGGLEDSQGIAFDPKAGTLAVSEESEEKVILYSVGHGAPRQAHVIGPPSEVGQAVEPEALAYGPDSTLYVIDAAQGQVLKYGRSFQLGLGGHALEVPGQKSFAFGSGDNDVAVAPNGTAFVLSGKGDGKIWAFAPTGKFLWELEPESGDEFASLAVDGKGNLWIAEPNGDTYEYAHPGAARAPERSGAKIEAGNEVGALAFAGSGHLFVARELDGTLTTLGNVISQIATELGFLLVPMALASMKG